MHLRSTRYRDRVATRKLNSIPDTYRSVGLSIPARIIAARQVKTSCRCA